MSLIPATNGLGWVIESHTRRHGWLAITQPYPTIEQAQAVRDTLESLKHPDDKGELRVYEALAGVV